jgi:hypothetical protein
MMNFFMTSPKQDLFKEKRFAPVPLSYGINSVGQWNEGREMAGSGAQLSETARFGP